MLLQLSVGDLPRGFLGGSRARAPLIYSGARDADSLLRIICRAPRADVQLLAGFYSFAGCLARARQWGVRVQTLGCCVGGVGGFIMCCWVCGGFCDVVFFWLGETREGNIGRGSECFVVCNGDFCWIIGAVG